MEALEADVSEFAAETLKTLSRMSPTSLALTFEQMKRGGAMDFDDNMIMELRIVRRIMEGRDFFEGVRAQIIDKDRSPKWSPADLSDVGDEFIQSHFEPLGDADLQLP